MTAPAAAPEKAATPSRTGWIRRLSPFLRSQRRDVVISIIAAIVGALVTAAVPVVERQMIDDMTAHRPTSAIWPWIGLLGVLAAALFLASHLRRYRASKVLLEVQFELRNAAHAQLQRLDLASHRSMPTGQLVARLSSDTGTLVQVLSMIPTMSGSIVTMVGSVCVMLWLQPALTAASLAVLPVLVLLVNRMRRRMRPANWDAQQRNAALTGLMQQGLAGIRVVKGFGQEEHEVARAAKAAEALYGSRLRAIRTQVRYQPLIGAIPNIGLAVILGYGGWLALHGHMDIGTLLLFSTYLIFLVSPARLLAVMFTALQGAATAGERVFDLLDAEPGVADAPDARPAPPLTGLVEFEDVHFGYLPGEPVLRGVSVRIEPGEKIALVGASGSGKTTLAMLLARLHDPNTGRVLVDDLDMRGLTLASLRGQVGFAFEDSFLFTETIRANIAYGRPDATDAEVAAAARAAGAEEFVEQLPLGYQTIVGERGLTLSGGQRQRIALARALLTDPRILVLDDATSAVDARVEQGIVQTLREVLPGRTAVLVAHRRSTLGLADRILVLDRGRIVDQGTHAQLEARCEHYRQLLAGPGESIDERTVVVASKPAATPTPSGLITPEAWKPAASGPRRPLILSGSAAIRKAMEKLPPIRDTSGVDPTEAAAHQGRFSVRWFTNGFLGALLLGLVLVLLDSGADAVGPYLNKETIDNGVLARSQNTILVSSLALVGVTLVGLVVNRWMLLVTGRVGERMLCALRIKIWAQLQRLPVDFHDRQMSGQVLTRATADVTAFANLLSDGVVTAAASMLTLVGVLIAMTILSPMLTLVASGVLIPFAVATALYRSRARTPYQQARERLSDVNATLVENLSGIRESQAYGQEAEGHTKFRKLTRDFLTPRLATQRLISIYFPFIEALSVIEEAVIFAYGYHLVIQGKLGAGVLVAFLLYVDLFFAPIQQLSGVVDDWQQARVALGRIRDLMAESTEDDAEAPPVATTPTVDAPPLEIRGELTFEHVAFTYPRATDPALREIDLSVPAGQTVAVVGQTGAGKSTLVNLLIRFHDPSSGRILVDGRDLRDLDRAAYRRRLGYVPQEPYLFPGTVRDNIAYGRPDAKPAEVEAAARQVGAHDLVAGLSGGYLHNLAERGASLSAGQRQLLCLARAALVDPAVLLLDEATSNVDLATEAQIVQAMESLSAGRTTVIVAHRLQTAARADRIVVFAEGRIVEQGSHAELSGRDSVYARMWQAGANTTSMTPLTQTSTTA